MNKDESNLTRFDKLKTIFYLGLSCNFTSIVGTVAVWVALTKLEYSSSLFATLFLALCFVPIFMADAVNNYTLARIKIDEEKGWDDIQVTPEGRKKACKRYNIYRAISIFPTYGLAAIFVASHSKSAIFQSTNIMQHLKLLFLVLFVVSFTRTMTFLKSAVVPRLPSFGGGAFLRRMIFISVGFSLWFLSLWQWNSYPATKLYIIGSGILYFILSGFMHPLPTKFSLLTRGKPTCPESFFTIELINEKELLKLSKEKILDQINNKVFGNEEIGEGFQFLRCFKMPLIEYPLAKMWGVTYLNKEKNILAIFFENEIKPGISCTLLSSKDKDYIITTNFHSEGANFPSTIYYEQIENTQKPSELLKFHCNRLIQGSENLTSSPWKHLKNIFNQIIEFLQTGPTCYKKVSKVVPENTRN